MDEKKATSDFAQRNAVASGKAGQYYDKHPI
jgi:hypothetical protein